MRAVLRPLDATSDPDPKKLDPRLALRRASKASKSAATINSSWPIILSMSGLYRWVVRREGPVATLLTACARRDAVTVAPV